MEYRFNLYFTMEETTFLLVFSLLFVSDQSQQSNLANLFINTYGLLPRQDRVSGIVN